MSTQDSGAIGRLNEVLAGHRKTVVCDGDDWNEPAEEDLYCSCSDEALGGWVHTAESHEPPDWDAMHEAHVAEHLANLVREHTDRALAEVEQRIEATLPPMRTEAAHGRLDALRIVRAARQEQ